MGTRHYVSDDLSIMTYGPNLVIQSQAGHDEGAVGVNEAELPALLAVLETAAGEMGVSTGRAGWKDVATRMLRVMKYMAEMDMGPKDFPADMVAIEKTFAEMERGDVA